MYYRYVLQTYKPCAGILQAYLPNVPACISIHPFIHSSTHTTFNTHRVRLNQPALVPIQSAPIDSSAIAFAIRLVWLVLVVLVVLVAALEG